MFGFLRQPKPAPPPAPRAGAETVGCFGKLPIQPDFIKYNLAHREVLALDQWVQEGYGLWLRGGARRAGVEAVPCVQHCVFGGTRDDRTLLATLIASRDQSGRDYPSVIFRLAAAQWLSQRSAAVPLIYSSFFREAAKVCRHPWRKETFKHVAAAVDRLHGVDIEDGDAAAAAEDRLLAATPISMLWTLLDAGEPPGRAKVLHAFIDALREVAWRGPQRTPWGIRLPLPDGEAAAAVRLVWLRLIDAVLGRGQWRATYIWNEQEAGRAPGLTVFFRTMPPSSLAQLLAPVADASASLDVTREAQRSGEPSAVAQRLASIRSGNLLDFVRAFGNGRAEQ